MPYVPSPRRRRSYDASSPSTASSINSDLLSSDDSLITASIDPLLDDTRLKNKISTSPNHFLKSSANNNNNNNDNNSNNSENHDAFSHHISPVPKPMEKQSPFSINDSGSHLNDNNQDQDQDHDLPLSLSFIRKPSRSATIDSDIDCLMKKNTLFNSRLFQHNKPLDETSIENPQSPISPLASLSNLQLNSTSSPVNRSYALVRKKSGELVKSSLRLNSIFKNSGAASLPTTPLGIDKQVHFGDSIDVKYFNQKDKPNFISAGNSPFNSDTEIFEEDEEDRNESRSESDHLNGDTSQQNEKEEEADIEADMRYYGISLSNSNGEISSVLDLGNPWIKILSACRKYDENPSLHNQERFIFALKDWTLDTTSLKLFSYRDKIDCEVPVFLERCFLNLQKTVIVGQLAVKNFSFDKRVNVKYTVDDWKTAFNVDAHYTPDIPRILKKAGYDRFTFQFSTHTLLSTYFKSLHFCTAHLMPTIEFCIKYTCCGQEFWDNNNLINYRLIFFNDRVCHSYNNSSHSKNNIDQIAISEIGNAFPALPNTKVSPPQGYFDAGVKVESANKLALKSNYSESLESLPQSVGRDNYKAQSSKHVSRPRDEMKKSFEALGNNGVKTLKRSKSFDKREKNKTAIRLDSFEADACKFPTIVGLKENFRTTDLNDCSTTFELKDENEYTLFKLKDVKTPADDSKSADIESRPRNDKYFDKENQENGESEIQNRFEEPSSDISIGKEFEKKAQPDMRDKNAYDQLLEKYCFYRGPTYASTLFENKREENGGGDVYNDKYY